MKASVDFNLPIRLGRYQYDVRASAPAEESGEFILILFHVNAVVYWSIYLDEKQADLITASPSNII